MFAVREIRLEDAFLDEHGALRRRPLVVHGRGATLTGVASVVDDRDELARDLLTDAPRVHRQAFEVEVRLEAVADRFVDERASRVTRKDDGVRARGRRLRGDVLDR